MRRSAFFVFLLACIVDACGISARAQVAPSATLNRMTITAGVLGSGFQPDYAGNGVAESASNWLIGPGAYVDVRFSRWVQAEAEGRWLRFNQFANIYQDNYLIGPKVPIHNFGRFTPYGKVLFGFSKMNFQYNYAYGRFTDIAYGGGVDMKLSDRWTLRPVDFEYQQWPNWINGSLNPYGVSVGIGYKIF
ncbi:MAG TPA: outer membrane beta-barrel protein [Terracidiphilus sp.]|nr:outer membrane beta-barrel protein [Terracidiphilus sp.]